jgi:hypothetical protein
VEPLKKGLNNMMAGGGFTVLIPPLPKNPNKQRIEVVNSIYSDIMEAQPGKPARCISAEVLRDQRHVAEIFKLGNPQAKMDYLETQKKLLLVSKIVEIKIRSLAQVEEENLNLKTVEEPNIKLRELHCLLTWSCL